MAEVHQSAAQRREVDAKIDRIMESMVQIMPLLHKKIMRMDLGGVTGKLTRLHFAVMGTLIEGNMPMTELARTIAMPKSQLTHVIDQLVRLGTVTRQQDATDRRVINLSLTDQGRVMLDDMKLQVKEVIKTKLSVLAPADLEEMAAALETIRNIGAKL